MQAYNNIVCLSVWPHPWVNVVHYGPILGSYCYENFFYPGEGQTVPLSPLTSVGAVTQRTNEGTGAEILKLKGQIFQIVIIIRFSDYLMLYLLIE